MKSWTKIRKDRRLKVGKVEYQKDAPEHYSGMGLILCDGWPYTSVVFGSDENGWEHVSICMSGRVPSWDEMCTVKDMFWEDEEECIQIHPKKSEYVNLMENCLHIWRYKDGMILPEG